MAVTVNANATADVHNDPVTTLDLTTLTIGAGSDTALVAEIGIDGGTPTISSVTWDQGGTNQAMTLITSITNGTLARSYLYGLVNPTAGNKTLRVVISAGSEIFLNATAFNGVNQTGGATSFAHANTATGASGVPSVTITSAVGNMTIDCVMAPDLLQTPTQTQNFAQNGGAGSSAASSRASGAASVTHAWASVGVAWASCGCDIVASGGGAAASVALTGTVTGSITEADIVAGGETVILTLTNDTFVAASAATDIAVVGTPQSGSANNAQITLTFDVAPQQDDVVIAWCGHDSNGGSDVTPVTSGYTPIINDTASQPYFGVWYKRMGATPDSTVVLPASGAANDAGVAGCIVLRNVHTNVLGATTTTAGPTASTNPNPAAITTTADNSIVIAIAVSTSNDAAPGTVTNYTVFSSAGLNVSGVDGSTSAARRLIATSGTAEDPPAWSAWTTGTWKTATLEVLRAVTSPFNDQRANIAAGLDSAQSEAGGWDAKVAPNIPVANVVRTSDTVCTITLQAQADYNITAQETITATVPSTALAGASALVATPTFTVDPAGAVAGDALRYMQRRGQRPGAFVPAASKFGKRFR